MHRRLSILFYAVLAVALAVGEARSQTPGVLVQSNSTSQPATSSTVPRFAAAQVAGDLNKHLAAFRAAASSQPNFTLTKTHTGNDTVSDVADVVPLADLTLALTHTGSFVRGQTAAYTLLVRNTGSGSTTNAVTVVDALPAGLTATSLAGVGWNCTVASLSCTRNDALTAGASYPVITLTVNVASTAAASLTNTATVSGGGELSVSNHGASTMTTSAPLASPPVFVTEAHFAVDQNTNGLNRATLSLNASGTNTFLLAALHVEFDGGDPNWVATDNGVPGALLLKTDGYTGGAGNQRFQVFYWVNPPAGANNIVIQNTFTGSNEITASAVLLQNVSQTGPFGGMTLDVSPTGRTSESEAVATTASDLVLHLIADALVIRGTLGAGESSVSVANDGKQKLNAGDGDASLWISTKLGASPSTTVSSSGWPSGPSPSPRPLNAVALVLHGAGPDVQAPTAPTGLVVTPGSASQITPAWTTAMDNVGVPAIESNAATVPAPRRSRQSPR